MGQKVNPLGFRLGNLYTWKSRWYADKRQYKDLVLEDRRLRQVLMEKLKPAGVTLVDIERSLRTIQITVYVARPGVVIGRGGSALEMLKGEVAKSLNIKADDPRALKVDLKVEEVKQPELSAYLVAQRLADQLIKRYPHRRAVSQAIERVMGAGAKGIKIALAGRIGGAEISRREKYTQGTVPTQTLRADIDYAQYPALTKYGYIGIKVWIYKGEGEIN
ncbi:MAG: 30S ribosomal protein S3 [Candidatus Chisholmbacteria bacterium]|nr:30S ribosomal protein S3 [Candidatus Chisholmbacteria bacterium]